MASIKPENLFWDSCIFIAFLNNETETYDIPSIEQYLNDARDGKCRIYSSTIALAEVRPKFLAKRSIGSFGEFVEDLGGAVVLIDPSPNVMDLSGRLRDLQYKKSNSTRLLTTPDAIMLATAMHLEDDLGVKLDAFHTFDKGKKRGIEGNRAVPLLTYHEWCEGLEGNALAARAVKLHRCPPSHPSPKMDL